MAVLSGSERSNLPDSAFAYIQPGGKKVNGKTTPDSLRHYPVHDAAHVRNALARIAQGGRFGKEAMAKVRAAAKTHGVDADGESTGRSLESLYPEVRFIGNVPEVRMIEGSEDAHITGYAAVFNTLSRRLGGFVEKVMPTAFNESRTAGWPDVVCRFNHKDDMLLGTTGADTLRLEIDERGLHYEVIPPKHRSDVVELVQRGDVRYSSFAFRCLEPGVDDEWGINEFGFPMRSLLNVQTVDTAPVTDPAYRDTSAVARNMAGAIESLALWVDAEPSEVRSLLEAGQAKRFFTRSDRPSVPRVDRAAAEARDAAALDDPAISLRRWRYADEDAEVRRDVNDAEAADGEETPELRALREHASLCRKWVAGSPCARPDGHDGDHTPMCWGRHEGFPCARVDGHDGDHEPVRVSDGGMRTGASRRDADGYLRYAEDGDTELRDADNASQGLSAAEASARLAELRARMTQLD